MWALWRWYIFIFNLFNDLHNHSHIVFLICLKAMQQSTFWLVTLLVVVVIVGPVVAWRLYCLEMRPTLVDKLRLKQLKQM